MILQTRTLHNIQTVYTGSGQLRNMSRSNHAYEALGQTGIGNFREENKRCELPVSSWGNRGVSRSIKRHFEVNFK